MRRDDDGKPVVPQIVVLERRVDAPAGSGAITLGADRVIGRYRGPAEIRTLADKGVPLGSVQ